jgi:hypothetical protein
VQDPAIAYNDIAPWRYTELPRALGCKGWFTARATTCGELDQALDTAGRAASAQLHRPGLCSPLTAKNVAAARQARIALVSNAWPGQCK